MHVQSLLPACLPHQEAQQSPCECAECALIAELSHLPDQGAGGHHSTGGARPVAGLADLIAPLRTQVLCV